MRRILINNILHYTLNNSHELFKVLFPESASISVGRILYATLLQSGATEFKISDGWEKSAIAPPDFIFKRSSSVSLQKLNRISGPIGDALISNIKDEGEAQLDSDNVLRLIYLMETIGQAIHQDCNAVILFDPPDLENMKHYLSFELFIVLRNLFSSFEISKPGTPVAQAELFENDFRTFNDILNSEMFRHHGKISEAVEDAKLPIERGASIMTESSIKLVSAHPDLLRLKRKLITALPITAKIVDTVFGKMPGILAQALSDLAVPKLSANKRIVILNMGGVIDDVQKEMLRNSAS